MWSDNWMRVLQTLTLNTSVICIRPTYWMCVFLYLMRYTREESQVYIHFKFSSWVCIPTRSGHPSSSHIYQSSATITSHVRSTLTFICHSFSTFLQHSDFKWKDIYEHLMWHTWPHPWNLVTNGATSDLFCSYCWILQSKQNLSSSWQCKDINAYCLNHFNDSWKWTCQMARVYPLPPNMSREWKDEKSIPIYLRALSHAMCIIFITRSERNTFINQAT